jgi:hypothetical protein
MLRFQLTSRTEFQRLVATDPDTLTDLERAARFLYPQHTVFGGKVAGQTFGIDRPYWGSASDPGVLNYKFLGIRGIRGIRGDSRVRS